MTAASRRFAVVRVVAEAALAAALAAGGAALVIVGAARPAPAYRAAVTSATSLPAAPAVTPASSPAPSPAPAGLEIPAIGVHTPLIPLGLRSDGSVAVPPLGRRSPAGWYRDGPAPGDRGPAVVIGHVDSVRDGPAVFYHLRDLTAGAEVRVTRADGSTAVFAVTRKAWYPKKSFPTRTVYGPTAGPELRLITCGGGFDRIRRGYRENLVVFAVLRGVERA